MKPIIVGIDGSQAANHGRAVGYRRRHQPRCAATPSFGPRGPAGPVLVEASRDTEMICVGSVGIGRYARSILGSAATEPAEKALCPVAVLSTERSQPPPDINWIVVRMTDEPDNDAVAKYAALEAKLRKVPILVLGDRPEELTDHADGAFERRVQDWRQRHPEVRV